MQTPNNESKEETKQFTCEWNECNNNSDWFYCSCIKSRVNIWKLCKKRHITPVQMFLSCPYCSKKIVLGDKV